jgi:hypothetical protein
MIFVTTKNGRKKKFPSPLLFSCLIRDPGWIKIRIRDKHPESATLLDSGAHDVLTTSVLGSRPNSS